MTRLTFSILLAALLPGAALAGPDYGNPPLKTLDALLPPPSVVESAPVKTETGPHTAKYAQAVTQPAEDMMTEPAPAMAPAITHYADLLERRISRGEDGLNLFDYAAADQAGELSSITAYTDYLAAHPQDAVSEHDQIAYWANLYNALTLKVVLENYPVSSIRKIKSGLFKSGPWDRDAVTVNGKTLSLNDIEHEILRKKFPNPAYVHYMVNCASIGCPNLRETLWTGSTLMADRQQAARDYINSPRGVRIDGDELEISSIYDWYKEDFGGSKAGTLRHLREHADPDLAAAIDAGAKIDDYDYDWSLNR